MVPFLKVDEGLAPEQDRVQLMKPIDTLDDLLERAQRHQVFGTKIRSVINDAAEAEHGDGRPAVRLRGPDRRRRPGADHRARGQHPNPHKDQPVLLRDVIAEHVQGLPGDAAMMLKLTIPTQVGLYGDLASDPRVLRVVALSGGCGRDEAATCSPAIPP